MADNRLLLLSDVSNSRVSLTYTGIVVDDAVSTRKPRGYTYEGVLRRRVSFLSTSRANATKSACGWSSTDLSRDNGRARDIAAENRPRVDRKR